MQKLTKIILGIIATIISLALIYAAWGAGYSRFILIMSFVILGIILLATVIVVIYNKFKPEEPAYDVIKIPVGTHKAVQIFRECWIIHTNMQHTLAYWEDRENPPVLLRDESLLRIDNTQEFHDPITGDVFLGLEVDSRDGDKIGQYLAIIPIDGGENHIKNNWNRNISKNKTWTTFNLNKELPLTSARDKEDRLSLKQLELREEGATAREVSYLNQFKPQEPVKQQKQITEKPIIVEKPVPLEQLPVADQQRILEDAK